VIFNYFLIGKYGPIGAAYGTLFSYIIIFILNQIILKKLYGIDTFKVFPAIFKWYWTIWNMAVKMVFKRA
jgi:lipopolysaccharide exporter